MSTSNVLPSIVENDLLEQISNVDVVDQTEVAIMNDTINDSRNNTASGYTSSSSSSGIYEARELEINKWRRYYRDRNLQESMIALQTQVLNNLHSNTVLISNTVVPVL